MWGVTMLEHSLLLLLLIKQDFVYQQCGIFSNGHPWKEKKKKKEEEEEENYTQLPQIDIFWAKIPSNHQWGKNTPTFVFFLPPFFLIDSWFYEKL
jgi:hypothetical protein